MAHLKRRGSSGCSTVFIVLLYSEVIMPLLKAGMHLGVRVNTLFSLTQRLLHSTSRVTGVKQLPDGIYSTMITPFLDDEKKSIDWNGLDG